MVPWVQLGASTIPGDGGEIKLFRRGAEFSIRVGTYELMNSRVFGSEVALAEVACKRIADRDRARVLIGGLGMGFTLAATLDLVGARATVVVAELVPSVVEWNRVEMAEINGAALEDDRVSVREHDVAEVIRSETDLFDAILLDVDNGPSALTTKGNDRLYSIEGLRAAHAALREGGVLAVWSAGADPTFTKRLKKTGFTAEEVRVRARGTAGGSRFLIWIAQKR